jgi:hypothetical protein
MRRRLIGSILLAFAVVAGTNITLAARPLYVVCTVPGALDIFIVVDNFGGVGGAVQHCVQFWNGFPRGFSN